MNAASALLVELRDQAERVAAAKAEGDEAREAIEVAETDLLERVVEAVGLDAIDALCSVIKSVRSTTGAAADYWANGERARGLLVAKREGEDLYLCEDGGFYEHEHARDILISIGCDGVVYSEWGAMKVIERIAAALESHDNGNALATAEKMRERAERIRAVATLLGPVR